MEKELIQLFTFFQENVHYKSSLICNNLICSCFRLFDVIHSIIDTKNALIRITREVIEDFVNDGVIYAEIRTTPREYTVGEYVSEKDGIDIILNTIKEMEKQTGNRIIIRLLLSINRSESK